MRKRVSKTILLCNARRAHPVGGRATAIDLVSLSLDVVWLCARTSVLIRADANFLISLSARGARFLNELQPRVEVKHSVRKLGHSL